VEWGEHMSIFFSIIWNEILHPVPTRRPKKKGEKRAFFSQKSWIISSEIKPCSK